MTSPPTIASEPDSESTPIENKNGSGKSEAPAQHATPEQPPAAARPEEDTASLRQRLSDNSQSPDAILRAATESARALTGADGVALALRTGAVILCRARSGELAPELGSQLNAHSGFSGECLRTASILVCHDAAEDPRVDPEVCRQMGIRSIVAVPLRGAIGVAGILEAFSTRPNTFQEAQIDRLRELAVIAETAYEKERLAREQETLASLKPSRRLPALFTRSAASSKGIDSAVSGDSSEIKSPEAEDADSFPPRRYWVFGVTAVALLLVAGVWLSWREPVTELAGAAPTSTSMNTPSGTLSPSLQNQPLADGNGRVGRVTSDRPSAGVLKKASAVERTVGGSTTDRMTSGQGTATGAPVGNDNNIKSAEEGHPSESEKTLSPALAEANPNVAVIAETEPAPPITIAAAENHDQLSALLADPKPLPTVDVQVSQGATRGELIHEVDPVYPAQARALRISGLVVLEITISESGSVRDVKSISGGPLLVAAAVDAVRKWRYSPVLLNGKPVQAEKQITFSFKLP
jgi:TonB family protein